MSVLYFAHKIQVVYSALQRTTIHVYLINNLCEKARHSICHKRLTHNKKYHSGIRGIYITNTSTTMVFANEKTRFTTITVPRLLLLFP